MNHSVPQNENGDAAFVKALQLAEEILPNGPVGVKMGKLAINKGMDVSFYFMFILFSCRRRHISFLSTLLSFRHKLPSFPLSYSQVFPCRKRIHESVYMVNISAYKVIYLYCDKLPGP